MRPGRWTSGLAFTTVGRALARRLPVRGPIRLMLATYQRAPASRLPPATVTTSDFGDRFHVDFASWLEWQIWAFGTHERELGDFFSIEIRPGDACIDVGANIGVHSVRMARVTGPTGDVIAIEADPDLAGRLARNVALNNLHNVEVIQAAASDVSGRMVDLFTPPPLDPNKARASLLPHEYLSGETRPVPTVTIDDVTGDRRVAILKIDVEGAEIEVLRGAQQTLERDHPVIIFEYNRELMKDDDSPVDHCRSMGYDMVEMKVTRNRITGRPSTHLVPISDPLLGNVNVIARHHSSPRGGRH